MKFPFTSFPDIYTFTVLIRESLEKNSLSEFCTDDSLKKLAIFGRKLCEENEKYNLTAITDPQGIATLHFADSLLFSDLFTPNSRVGDIGCGAGFPSMPLAICRPDLQITSIDSTQKKVDFINETAKQLGLLNIHAVCGRAEELFAVGSDLRESFDIITARAVAPLGILSELCLPGVHENGRFIALKGDNLISECVLADGKATLKPLGGKSFDFTQKTLLGSEEYVRVAAVAVKYDKTDSRYPRRFADIKKKPLF